SGNKRGIRRGQGADFHNLAHRQVLDGQEGGRHGHRGYPQWQTRIGGLAVDHHPRRGFMTWTGAFGRACRVLLHAIVRGLALTRISPNVLTFLGLVINTVAAILFGYANPQNYSRMFLYAGLVIIGAGIFDMVDGRVARATGQVTTFGAFFDSVIDRYSDVALFFGLLVYYARGNHFFYLVLVAFVMVSSVMVSYTRARAESLIGSCKVGFME